jgi:DNA-binding NtrC family response regulator
MQALMRAVAEIAPTDIPVLLVGEGGTGKEVLAREIHKLSRRHDEPFIKMSCAALTAAAWNEWLDNIQKTDSHNHSSGQGTLFLDEISKLDPASQTRLLHALADDHASAPRLDVRVISATSQEQEMRAHRYRQELYYGIHGVCLHLPPLRQRKEDIPGLVEYFLSKYAAQYGLPVPSLRSQILQVLVEHSWPGNIRELQYVTQNIIMQGEERAVADLGSALLESLTGECLSLKQISLQASRRAERELILKVLTRTRWNRKRAAQELQISYKTLLYKLKQILDFSATSPESPRASVKQ